MEIKAVYPGTFDPLTNGHSDIVKRAAKLFNHVVLAIAASPGKTPLFSLQERIELATVVLADLPNVSICQFSGLLAEFVKQQQAQVLVRGLRAVSDFEYEFQLAGMNRSLMSEVETIFLPTSAQHTYISATLVREIALLGGPVAEFVHPQVVAALSRKMR